MANLYELTTEVLSLMDSDEVTDDQLSMAFGDITVKCENVCKYLAVLDANSDMFKKEIARLSDRRKAIDNHIQRIKEYLQVNMERLEIDSIDAGVFNVRLQNSPDSLEVIDKEKTPAAYRIFIPKTWEPDLKRIKEDLKAGKKIKGYSLKSGKHIRIR